jgi:hypothetical protein
MNVIHYIGLDVHKKTISYCIKTADGQIVQEGKLEASRLALRSWAESRREPWCGAMEATQPFSGTDGKYPNPNAPLKGAAETLRNEAIGPSSHRNRRCYIINIH